MTPDQQRPVDRRLTADMAKHEWLKCSESLLYFIDTFLFVYDATRRDWVRFALWVAQVRILRQFLNNRLVIILKARQLGLTWLVLGYALWLMIFRPIATVLLFSKRDDEAIEMLDRLKGMYERLPAFLKCRAIVEGNEHEFTLSNGSTAKAFPATGGDSYTATLVVFDEADLMPNFDRMLASTKPTIDAGGQMILISRSNKDKPSSGFKKLYVAAKQHLNDWLAIFLPWQARPDRDQAWYDTIKADAESRDALDELHEQYPATDVEALGARTRDKRIAPKWLQQCYEERSAWQPADGPAIPGLEIFVTPTEGRRYVIGSDPAEGNPTSDDSALEVLDYDTGEEAAKLAGKFQPSTLAAHIDTIGQYFNQADVLVERNNHGHAVLLWLRDNSRLKRLTGWDGKEGWLSNSRGKAMLYDAAADAFKDEDTTVHSFITYQQLASIEGSTLNAPEGDLDDCADSYALSLVARTRPRTIRMHVA